MSETMSASAATADRHPIGLIVTDDLQRNRLTVFFRLLLAIPHFIVVALWGIVAELAVLVAWFAAIFTGRVPGGLHNFIASWLRYATRVTAYTFLLADPFPPFGSGGSYPVDVRIDPAQRQSRLTVFFRLFLAIPALLLTYVFRAVNQIVALLGWFYALATGRMNEGMRDISAWLLRYETQTSGYVLLLTGRYPSLAGAPTA
jgi:ABC-type multidrug transport system fused ATPase/permease subunit